jgi:hypothetical protein
MVSGQTAQVSPMVGRILRLVLVAVLAIGLGGGVTLGNSQPFAGTAHLTLSAAPGLGNCSPCEDCAKPCLTSIMCGAACISLGLPSAVQRVAFIAHLRRLAAEPDWQLSSAELRTPTPPPRFSRSV